MAPRRGSCAPGASDADLIALFHELDVNVDGELSINELAKSLQTNREFAAVVTGNPGLQKPLNAISANLIAQNLQTIADTELGDCDGAIQPEEFVLLCRRLVGAPASKPPSRRSQRESKSEQEKPATQKAGFFSFGSKAKPPAREGRAEAKLYGLKTMLREDVIGVLEAVLMRASEQADAAGRASMYYEGVCAALVACKRLADTANDASAVVASAPSAGEPSGAPSSASTDALELERLRKELAETKVLLAEASNARDVTEHELRLEKQQSRSRSRSLFG